MKNTLIIISLTFLFVGCNMNPNKEARIQKLETEIQQLMEKVDQLEMKIGTLETTEEQLQNN